MKKILFSLCTFAVFMLPTGIQAAEYEEIMQANIKKLFQAQSAEDLQQACDQHGNHQRQVTFA